jgi:hypothetical protein
MAWYSTGGITTHSTRRLDSIPFMLVWWSVCWMLFARRGLIRALDSFDYFKGTQDEEKIFSYPLHTQNQRGGFLCEPPQMIPFGKPIRK